MNFRQLFERSLERSIELASLLPFDVSNKQQLFAISLYGSMIDCAHSLKVLIAGNAITGAPLIVRPMLEAYVSLELVLNDPEYLSFMDANFFRTWVRRMNQAEKQNPYLAVLATMEDFDKHRAEYESRQAQAADGKFKDIKIEERFKRAGMHDLYTSLYSFLSDHAHSSVGALINRHFQINRAGRLEVIILRDPERDEFDVHESTAAELLLKAGIALHKKCGTAREGPLIALLKLVRELSAETEPA